MENKKPDDSGLNHRAKDDALMATTEPARKARGSSPSEMPPMKEIHDA
jgi:hypothetical protein